MDYMLYFGAEKSNRVQENLSKVDRVARRYPVLPCDVDTASLYGRIAYHQRAKGRKIPYHDIWIAAITMQHNLTLLSRDDHFNEVDDLTVHTW